MAQGDELERSEIEALLATRRELGEEYDAALVESFADRIERAVDQRISGEVARRSHADAAVRSAGPRQLALGIVSVGVGIPITAINLAVPEDAPTSLIGLIVSWGGIAAVNFAHAVQSRRR